MQRGTTPMSPENPEEARHAWYSEYQAEVAGTAFYLNEKGEEVEVTQVATNLDSKRPEDAYYQGKVTKFVRNGRNGGELSFTDSFPKKS